MSDSGIAQTAVKLKVFTLVADSYRAVFGNLGTITRILWLVMVILVVMEFRFAGQKGSAASRVLVGADYEPVYFVYILVSWVLICGAYVSLHRFFLLGEKPPALGFSFQKRELRYLGYCLAITPVVMLPMGGLWLLESVEVVPMFLSAALTFAAIGFMMIWLIRLGFMFPAISLDQEGGLQRRFKHALALVDGNTGRMFLALIVALLPFVMILDIVPHIYSLSGAELMIADSPVFVMQAVTVIGSVADVYSKAVMIAMYSFAYRTLELSSAKQQVKA